jgi:hypothetical protein
MRQDETGSKQRGCSSPSILIHPVSFCSIVFPLFHGSLRRADSQRYRVAESLRSSAAMNCWSSARLRSDTAHISMPAFRQCTR